MDINDIQELTERETASFNLFRTEWEVTHPPPIYSDRGWMSLLGWQFFAMIPVTVAAMGLAAARTGFMFYLIEVLSATRFLGSANGGVVQTFSLIVAILAIFGIEGLLVVSGATKGYQSDSLNTPSWLPIVLLAISVTVGVGQSMEIIQNLNSQIRFWMQWGLALSTGIGASVAALFAAQALGWYVRQGETKRDAYRLAYKSEYLAWWEGMRDNWSRRVRKNLSGQRSVISQAAPAHEPEGLGASKRLEAWMVENNISPFDIGRGGKYAPADVARLLDINPDTLRPTLLRMRESANGNGNGH